MTDIALVSMSVTILFIMAGFIKKNSVFLFILQAVWMWALLAGNTNSIDYGVNSAIFDFAEADSGIPYQSVMYWFARQGYDYFAFNAVVATSALILLYILIYKKSQNPCFVMSLIFIFPFVDFVIQKRFFIASILSILFLYIFIAKKGLLWKIIAVLFFILAVTTHEGTALFLMFFLYPLFVRCHRKKLFFGVFFFLALILAAFLPQIAAMIPFVGEARAELYFVTLHEKIKYPMLTTLVFTLMHTGFVLLYYWLYRCSSAHGRTSYMGKAILYLDVLSLLILPAYYWEPTFFRMFRTLLPFNYIAISNMMPVGQIYKKKLFFQGVRYIVFAGIIFLGYYFVLSAGFDVVAQPIFEDNIFFE